jgi:hypothetical protein
VRNSKPGPASYYHGYFASINVGGAIALMTVDLGGFQLELLRRPEPGHRGRESPPSLEGHPFRGQQFHYHIHVRLFKPRVQTAVRISILANNLFFLCSMAIIAVSINHLRHRLVKKEFDLLVELKKARDAIWSEMELAKRIQTALLPYKEKVKDYEIAATMLPASKWAETITIS